MNTVYLVVVSNYENVVRECGVEATEILGAYKYRTDARNKAFEYIDKVLKDGYYVLDEERNNFDEDEFVRFFYNNQENWNDYFEVMIIEKEVQ